MPLRTLHNQSPLTALSQFYPMVNNFYKLPPKVIGCVAYVHIHTHERSTLDPRALKFVFLGYSTAQKGYECYDPKIRKFYVSMDVTFLEYESFFKPHNTYLQGERTLEDKEEDFFFEKNGPSCT